MKRVTASRLICLITVSLLGLACEQPTNQSPALSHSVSAAASQVPRSIDEVFAEIAELEPAFGGLFFDTATNQPVLVLTNREAEMSARNAIARIAPELSNLSSAAMLTREAEYGFSELYQWKLLLPQLFSIPQVIAYSIAEDINRLRVAVESTDARDNVREMLDRLQIPVSAVQIVVRERGQLASHDLRHTLRATAGGLQLEENPRIVGPCTLGFNAVRAGVISFATNGHCTHAWGDGSDNTPFHQCCHSNSSDLIGYEYLEAGVFTNVQDSRCPAGAQCKYSDIALGGYSSGVSYAAAIARTVDRQPLVGSILIDWNNGPYLHVTNNSLGPLLGQTVDKIGRTTGWTYGVVTETAMTERWCSGACYYIIDAYVADGGVQGGDSGSAVFFWNGGSEATIAGQLFGRIGTSRFVFSIWNFIVGDPTVGYLGAKVGEL